MTKDDLVVPPFSEFREWLQALPDDYAFNSGGFGWSCGCPVATFLREHNDGRMVSAAASRACFYETEEHTQRRLPVSYSTFIRRIDAFYNNGTVAKADAVACLDGADE